MLRLLGWVGVGEDYFAHHPRLSGREALKALGAGVCADDAYCRPLEKTDPAAALRRPDVVRGNGRGEFKRRSRVSFAA